jgi:hypothetical protein
MLRRSVRPLQAALATARAAEHQQQQAAWQAGGAALGAAARRWLSEPSSSAKEAVERTLVVNTLDLVRAAQRLAGGGG